MSDPASDPPRLHPFEPAVRFDVGDLDCGSGLLLQIRRRIDPLDPGQLLEIHSTEPSVSEDLPAWCRLTGNELVSTWHDCDQGSWSFLISKNRFSPVVAQADAAGSPRSASLTTETSQVSATSAGAGARGKNR
ncbi:MAG: sulfurtransferase TusA family protein, partial [Isosphaeraceae bacterium]